MILMVSINKEDMIGIKLAYEMVNSAKRNFTNAKALSNEQKKLRLNIGLKRKSEMQRLMVLKNQSRLSISCNIVLKKTKTFSFIFY